MRKIKVATKASEVKETQAMIELLKAMQPELAFEVVEVSATPGDCQRENLTENAYVVREIERRLIACEIDFAVHRLIDLPVDLPEGLVLAAHPKRSNPLDVVVYPASSERRISEGGLRLGLSASRQKIQLEQNFPPFEEVAVLANLEEGRAKLASGELDGLVLAPADWQALSERESLLDEPLCPSACVPVVAQGILGLVCRMDDESVFGLLRQVSDLETEQMALAERKFLALAQENSAFAVGALAQNFDDDWYFLAFLAKDRAAHGRSIQLTGKNPLILAVQAYEALSK